jgi:hypothetical protein
MRRITWMLSALFFFAVVTTARTAEPAPAGTWKLSIFQKPEGDREPQLETLWIIELKSKDGQWTGTVLASPGRMPKAKVEGLKVTDDVLHFTLKIENQELAFEGKLPKEKGGKILGSFSIGRKITPGDMEATNARSFDPVELAKEALLTGPTDNPALFDAAQDLLGMASENKAKPEEVRGWAERMYKVAAGFGPRWQREIGVRITQILNRQEAYAGIALEYARRTERMLEPTDDANLQIRILNALASTLKKNNKNDEAKEIEARLDKLEAKADAEYLKKMPGYEPEPYRGRKNKSDRAVLVELFTGAQCPPCVAADLAFDGLVKTYKPHEVVLLQYHLHVPGPDPLTNPDTEARREYYGKALQGTPTAFFNGTPKAEGGGDIDAAKDKYFDYRDIINPLLEKPAKAELKVSATRQGDKIDIQAEVSDLEKPSDKIRLRFALVEEQVRYVGGNQLRFHHDVVRALPGGADGFPLKEKTAKQTATINLADLRKNLTSYLDDFGKKVPFPNDRRPLDLKKVKVVAFVQDDDTKEVLQAAQVEVKGAEAEAETK